MAFCVNADCEEEYPDRRLELGYKTCLSCGRKSAIQEARAKARRVAPAYNKGAYMYISDDTMKNDLCSIGRKV